MTSVCINSLFEHLVLRPDFRNNFFNVTIRKCHSGLVSLFSEGIKRIFPFSGERVLEKGKRILRLDFFINLRIESCAVMPFLEQFSFKDIKNTCFLYCYDLY